MTRSPTGRPRAGRSVGGALELADTAYLMARGAIAWSGPAAALDTDAITRAYLGHADQVPVAPSAGTPYPGDHAEGR